MNGGADERVIENDALAVASVFRKGCVPLGDAAPKDAERTDDEAVIGANFAKKYSEIYKKKQINQEKLTKLMENIDWKLTEEEMTLMSAPISEEEVWETIINLPNDKSQGPYR